MAQALTTIPRQDVARTDTKQTRRNVVYQPNTDIYEDSEHVVLTIDMPGVAPNDVDVTLERRVLTIRGRVHTERPSRYRPIRLEYGEGDFERSFTISDDIARDQIEAVHKNGVLTLKLPKAESAKAKRITVKGA